MQRPIQLQLLYFCPTRMKAERWRTHLCLAACPSWSLFPFSNWRYRSLQTAVVYVRYSMNAIGDVRRQENTLGRPRIGFYFRFSLYKFSTTRSISVWRIYKTNVFRHNRTVVKNCKWRGDDAHREKSESVGAKETERKLNLFQSKHNNTKQSSHKLCNPRAAAHSSDRYFLFVKQGSQAYRKIAQEQIVQTMSRNIFFFQ